MTTQAINTTHTDKVKRLRDEEVNFTFSKKFRAEGANQARAGIQLPQLNNAVNAIVIEGVNTIAIENEISNKKSLTLQDRVEILEKTAQAQISVIDNLTRKITRLKSKAVFPPQFENQQNAAYIWNKKGCELLNENKDSEALICFDEALKLDPKYLDALMNKGSILVKQDKLSDAHIYFDRVIELNPKIDIAWNFIGKILTTQNKIPEASVYFKMAIKLNPRNDYAWSNMGCVLLAQGKLEEALFYFDNAIMLNPENVGALKSKGIVFEKQNKRAEALICFQQALKSNPTCPFMRASVKLIQAALGT